MTSDNEGNGDSMGLKSIRTVVFKPSKMTFKEYDRKMLSLRPDLKYWKTVITENKPWDQKKEDKTDKYTTEEKEKLKQTDAIAHTAYIQGNGGATDFYLDGDTAYEIRQALVRRFQGTEAWSLPVVQEKYNEVLRREPYACPDKWLSDLHYYNNLIKRAGGALKTDAELVAHIVATAPKAYGTITAIVRSMDLSTEDVLDRAIDQYRMHWTTFYEPQIKHVNRRANFYNRSANVNEVRGPEFVKQNKNNEVLNTYGDTEINSTRPERKGPRGKPWKKFKGNCRTCGTQGHKSQNCPQLKSKSHHESRKCYNCGKKGHLSRDCKQPKRQQSMFVGHISAVDIDPNEFEIERMSENKEEMVQDPPVIDLTGDEKSDESSEDEEMEDEVETIRPEDMYSSESLFASSDDLSLATLETQEVMAFEIPHLSDPIDSDAVHENEENEDFSSEEDDESIVCIARDTYQWRGVVLANVIWCCTNCKNPVAVLSDGRKLCGVCEVLEEYYEEHPNGIKVGQCKHCGNFGIEGYRCFYCLDYDMSLISDDGYPVNTLGTVVMTMYANKKKSLLEAAKWQNFLQWVKMNDIEHITWKSTMNYSLQYPEKLIYWFCSDHRCAYQHVNCNIWCLECGKSARTEIFRSFDRRVAYGYNEDIVEDVGGGRICKWVSDLAWLDATFTHAQEVEEVKNEYESNDNSTGHPRDAYIKKQREKEEEESAKHSARMKVLCATMKEAKKEWVKEEKYAKFEPMEEPIYLPNYMVHYTLLPDTKAFKYDMPSYVSAYREVFSTTSSQGDGPYWPGKPPAERPFWLSGDRAFNVMDVLAKVKDYYSMETVATAASAAAALENGESINMALTKCAFSRCAIDEKLKNGSESWLFDTGATVHVTPNIRLLTNLQACRVKVKVADGSELVARERGDIFLRTNGGSQVILVLKGVLVIPEFKKNIISASRLVRGNRYSIVITSTAAKVINAMDQELNMEFDKREQIWFVRGRRVIARYYENKNSLSSRKNNKYSSTEVTEYITVPCLRDQPQVKCTQTAGTTTKYQHTRTDTEDVLNINDTKPHPQARGKNARISDVLDVTETRNQGKQEKSPKTEGKTKNKNVQGLNMDINEAHQKFGHVSEEILRRSMKYHGINVTGTLRPCAACAMFKARARNVEKVSKNKATKPGQRLFMDIQGPFPMPLTGAKYWVKFKDQYSGMTWNHYIRYKNEIATQLKIRLERIRQNGIKVEYLRCDNAGEQQGPVHRACKNFGVQLEYTAPNTPQHNGAVERQFATDWSRANAMLEAADLTEGTRHRLRQLAIDNATLIYNTSCNNGHQTPYELFFGKKPTISPINMIQFGRMGYVTDRSKIKSKLQPKAFKCLFVGYALNHSAHTYKMFNPVTNKIILTRDIKWDEWDIVDPKSHMNTHRRTMVNKLLNKPMMSQADKAQLKQLMNHYLKTGVHDRQPPGLFQTDNDMVFTNPSHPNGRFVTDLDDEQFYKFMTGPIPELTAQHTNPQELDQDDSPDDEYPMAYRSTGGQLHSSEDNYYHPNRYIEQEELYTGEGNNREPYASLQQTEEEEDHQQRDLESQEEDSELRDIHDTQVRRNRIRGIGRELRNLDTEYNPVLRRNNRQLRQLDTSYNQVYAVENHQAENITPEHQEWYEKVYSAVTSDPGEPTSFKEAITGPNKEKWIEAIKKELNNFMSRGVWQKIPRTKVVGEMKRKLITCKWIFKKKLEQDGSIRFKARCVSRGFMQIPGVDFTESFAPVASDTSIRTLISIFLFMLHISKDEWVLEMMDAEAAFLNADLGESRVFIEWPQGMVELGILTEHDYKFYCAELKKAMYGNIDSPLRWMKTFSGYLINQLKLTQSQTDPCIFYKKNKWDHLVLILALYVDDTLIAGTRSEVDWLYEQVQKKFKIEKLGRLKKHLGIWWEWHKDGNQTYLSASMDKMIEDIRIKFKAAVGRDAKQASTPGFPGQMLTKNKGDVIMLDEYRSLVGKIMYYATKIGPDICNAARDLATHLSSPSYEHWKALERCVGYLTSLKDSKLIFRKPRELRSISYCDSDYAKSEDDRKSIAGRINTVGGTITNWTSKKQATVALSSTESEYQALSDCTQEAMFTQNLIEELTGVKEPAIIYEDNLGAIFLCKNQQVSSRTKHIDVRHHYMRNLLEDKRLEIRFVRSEDNSSDICTKNTPKDIHDKHALKIKDGKLDCWKEDVKSKPSKGLNEQVNRVTTHRRGSSL